MPTMKTLQITAPGKFEWSDVPQPEPGTGQVLVKIEAVTTCPHWDMHIFGGEPMFPGMELTYPYWAGQPGHEAVGEVTAVGPGVTELQVGQRVCCWRDPGHNRPGCYAQYVARDVCDVLPIPREGSARAWASLELAMCVSAHVMLAERLNALKGKRVGVFGLGPSGLIFAQLARAAGASEVIGVDPVAERRALALDLGVNLALDPTQGELDGLPARMQPGCFDTAFDCVGNPRVVRQAMDLTTQLVVLFAVQRAPFEFAPHHWGRLIVAGAQPHTREAAEYARDRIAAGQLTLEPLVNHEGSLERYDEAVELLKTQQAIKVIFYPNQE